MDGAAARCNFTRTRLYRKARRCGTGVLLYRTSGPDLARNRQERSCRAKSLPTTGPTFVAVLDALTDEFGALGRQVCELSLGDMILFLVSTQPAKRKGALARP